MRSDDLASLFLQGQAGVGWHTGVIESWDDLTGLNTVLIENASFDNLRVLATGAVQPFQIGDVVGVLSIGTQYFILGKIRAAGAGAGERVASAAVDDFVSVPLNTDYADLPGSPGPSVSLYVGSARRVQVIHSCEFSIGSASDWSYRGSGFQGVAVSGASTIEPGTVKDATCSVAGDTILQLTSSSLLDTSGGLNEGLNTFTCKYFGYKTGDIAAVNVLNRVLTVIPL